MYDESEADDVCVMSEKEKCNYFLEVSLLPVSDKKVSQVHDTVE